MKLSIYSFSPNNAKPHVSGFAFTVTPPMDNSVTTEVKESVPQYISPEDRVVKPLIKPDFNITFDPKTKIWEELIGYDKDGQEVWKVIP